VFTANAHITKITTIYGISYSRIQDTEEKVLFSPSKVPFIIDRSEKILTMFITHALEVKGMEFQEISSS
jgi:hypothetical protein